MSDLFGYTTTDSTSKKINVIAVPNENLTSIVGKMVSLDIQVENDLYRCLGTITDIRTINSSFSPQVEMLSTKHPDLPKSDDLRKLEFSIQATFQQAEGSDTWTKYSSVLPTSPSTLQPVYILDENHVQDLIANEEYPTIGFFRGMGTAPQPLDIPDFGGPAGSAHFGVIGKSGSGKDLALTTPIPTPTGWTTMGDLKTGDWVLSEEGAPIKVLKAHEVIEDSLCYEVTFSDGSTIIAGSGHLWYTETVEARKSISQQKFYQGKRKENSYHSPEITSSIRKLADTVDPDQVISVQDATKLIKTVTGKDTSTIINSVARTLPVVSTKTETTVKPYSTQDFTYQREIIVFSSKELKTKIAKIVHKRITPSLISKIETANLPDFVTRQEIFSLVGYEKANGAAQTFLNRLNLASEFKIQPVKVPGTQYRASTQKRTTPISLYNAQTLINRVAEQGSRVMNVQKHKIIQGSVKTTQEIFETLTDKHGKINHSIPVSKALELPEAELPIHPYLLGAWLGGGRSSRGTIYGIDKEIIDNVQTLGNRTLTSTKEEFGELNRVPCFAWTVSGLRKELRENDLLNNKHIPASYLRSSLSQRKLLLAGLLDTDGTTSTKGSIEFTTTKRNLGKEVQELALSLGYRATLRKGEAKLYGRYISDKWTVSFTTKEEVFLLPRKVATHQARRTRFNESKNNSRYIISIKKVETVPTRCITVDSPTALYLAGENFIPTHNTAMYTYMLTASMKHEQQAILVIDPQGQWANENGMVMSAQKFAKGLGRDVSVLRVAEDIRLPMSEDVFSRMVLTLNLWKKFRRMGTENKEAFSDAVAAKIANLQSKDYDKEPRDLLSKIFADIAYSQSSLDRIYVRGERQDGFRRDLLLLAGEPIIDPETEEQELITESDKEDIEQNWNSILSVFTPLINLFSSKNINGGRRTSMDGQYGFLKDVFQIRNSKSAPAPYVVLDMSPSVALHAKAGLLQGSNAAVNMQAVLDNQEVKALIILLLLDEMKKASEIAFSAGGGNLNTQIVFDEAWRYAPEGKADPIIEELANKLEGFALDTRKFGIGWTYILQSPGDLKTGIWRQLSYVYVGYGLVGDDVRKLESLTDDVKQIDLYRQFIPPKSTGVYPFMLMGPISPVIFTTAPAFVNVFTKTEDFLYYNHKWIEEITNNRSLPKLTMEYLNQKTKATKIEETFAEKKSYSVGKGSNVVKSKPQTETVLPPLPSKEEETPGLIEEMPF